MRKLFVTAMLPFLGFSALACEPVVDGKKSLVPDIAAAIRTAKAAWAADGRSMFAKDAIARFEPYKADHERFEWHVYGTLSGPDGKPILGGTPEATVCESDGKTKVWHSK